MNALELVRDARSAGVQLHLREGLKVTVTGPDPVKAEWLPRLKSHRDEVREVLQLEHAERALQDFAQRHGIPWPAARVHLTDADVLAGHESLRYAEQTQSTPELRMLQGWLHSLVKGAPWKG